MGGGSRRDVNRLKGDVRGGLEDVHFGEEAKEVDPLAESKLE